MTNRGIWGVIVAIAFVAGSLTTGTMAYAAPGGGNNPFNAIQQQLDVLEATVDSFFDVFVELTTDPNTGTQIDSFFDVFTEISVHDQDVADLRSEIASIPEGPEGPAGADGQNGADGQDGADGADGINCWDLNGNGIGDIAEDLNGDGIVDVLDCRGPEGPEGPEGPAGSNDFSDLTNVPGGLANGDQDALRTYNKDPPYGAPCNSLNSDTSTVSYFMRDNAAIEQLGFDPFIGNLPIFAEASSEPFLGEIILFGGNFAPRGWAFAQGQLLPIAQNQALFALYGTMYGGDGRTTFALPDLRCLEPNVPGSYGPHYIVALQGVFPSRS